MIYCLNIFDRWGARYCILEASHLLTQNFIIRFLLGKKNQIRGGLFSAKVLAVRVLVNNVTMNKYIFFPSTELQKHFYVKRKTMLSIYSTCEVQSWTKRLGHFVFHVKKIAIRVNPSSSWTVLGFTSQTLFFKSCPNYGPHLCSGRGEKAC